MKKISSTIAMSLNIITILSNLRKIDGAFVVFDVLDDIVYLYEIDY